MQTRAVRPAASGRTCSAFESSTAQASYYCRAHCRVASYAVALHGERSGERNPPDALLGWCRVKRSGRSCSEGPCVAICITACTHAPQWRGAPEWMCAQASCIGHSSSPVQAAIMLALPGARSVCRAACRCRLWAVRRMLGPHSTAEANRSMGRTWHIERSSRSSPLNSDSMHASNCP
jgi:hypothetical protein